MKSFVEYLTEAVKKTNFKKTVSGYCADILKINGMTPRNYTGKVDFDMSEVERGMFEITHDFDGGFVADYDVQDNRRFKSSVKNFEEDIKSFEKVFGGKAKAYKVDFMRGATAKTSLKSRDGYTVEIGMEYSPRNDVAVYSFEITGNKIDQKFVEFDVLPEFNVGAILETSFGYDMTIIDFYQIVKRSGLTVYTKELNKKIVSGDGQVGKVVPVPNSFASNKVYRSKLDVSSKSCQAGEFKNRARLWNGNPSYFNTLD